jgi:hypothetical protein
MKYFYGILLVLCVISIVSLCLLGINDLNIGKILIVVCSAFAATSIMKLVSLNKNS